MAAGSRGRGSDLLKCRVLDARLSFVTDSRRSIATLAGRRLIPSL